MLDAELKRDFRKLVEAKLEEAYALFDLPIDILNVKILFNLKGRTGGTAGYKIVNGVREYYLRFNVEGIEKHWDYMVNAVISHEIAHLVAHMNPNYGAKNHNANWSRIDRMLGGNGKRCHNMPLSKARKTKWYLYEVGGNVIKMSSVRHNRLHRGTTSYSLNGPEGRYSIERHHFTGKVMVA